MRPNIARIYYRGSELNRVQKMHFYLNKNYHFSTIERSRIASTEKSIFRSKIIKILNQNSYSNSLSKLPIQTPYSKSLFKYPIHSPRSNPQIKIPIQNFKSFIQNPHSKAPFKIAIQNPYSKSLFKTFSRASADPHVFGHALFENCVHFQCRTHFLLEFH